MTRKIDRLKVTFTFFMVSDVGSMYLLRSTVGLILDLLLIDWENIISNPVIITNRNKLSLGEKVQKFTVGIPDASVAAHTA